MMYGGGTSVVSESGCSLLARLLPRAPVSLMLNQLWPEHPCTTTEIIQISGPCCSGKTQLLLSCVLSALMSDAVSTVLLLDADRQLRAQRLVVMATGQLAALRRLHVATPTSSSQLMVTIEAALSVQPGPVLVAIDSLSTFYWSDRHQLSLVGTRTDAHYRQLAARLAALVRQKRLILVCTRHHLSAADSRWDLMGSEWSGCVTRTVQMNRGRGEGVFTARGSCTGHAAVVEKQLLVDDEGVRWLDAA